MLGRQRNDGGNDDEKIAPIMKLFQISLQHLDCISKLHVHKQISTPFASIANTEEDLTLPMLSYFCPEHNDAKNFENHLNLVMLVFIR